MADATLSSSNVKGEHKLYNTTELQNSKTNRLIHMDTKVSLKILVFVKFVKIVASKILMILINWNKLNKQKSMTAQGVSNFKKGQKLNLKKFITITCH